MFSVREIAVGGGILQYRTEDLTGLRCRISPERVKRGIDVPFSYKGTDIGCPFCPGLISSATPTFQDGTRILIGESTTFPNLYPFAECHTVTVISSRHMVDGFTKKMLLDAFEGQIESLSSAHGYTSVNWNYLPSAGASLAHPHLQGLADQQPSAIAGLYMEHGKQYHDSNGRWYWDAWKEHERFTERYLFGDEIFWSAHAVPLGEREVRGILPVSTLEDALPYLDEFIDGLVRIIEFYRSLGTHAFNMALFFDKENRNNGFRAFCSMISRINPNSLSLSDSAFMERIHMEPVIMTLPEELGRIYRKKD